MRTREGMAIARAKGRLQRQGPQAQPDQARGPAQAPRRRRPHDRRLAALFSVSRATIYRELARTNNKTSPSNSDVEGVR
jgi:DNA invertase Pin-like site-specific DNA recombinase